MSIKLIKLIKPLEGLTFGEKSILFQLADISHDSETVFIRMELLARYAGCDIRTARRLVRQLEKKGLITEEGEVTGGRGYIHTWRFNIEPTPQPVEDTPPASTGFSNGYAPPAGGVGPHETPSNVSPEYEGNPRRKRPGETFREYNERISQLPSGAK